MDDILTLSLTELTGRLRAGKVSPVELMGSVLDRIDQTNGDLNEIGRATCRERVFRTV